MVLENESTIGEKEKRGENKQNKSLPKFNISVIRKGGISALLVLVNIAFLLC